MKQLLAAGLGAVLVPVLALSVLVAVLFGSDDDAAAAAVPGGQAGVVCAPAPAAGSSGEREVAGFSGNQLDVAAAIVAQGKALGVPERGWVVAVATAMQESTLRTLNYGDTMPNGRMSSSRGPFQQLDAWGPLQDRLDPARSAAMFYTGGKRRATRAAGHPRLAATADHRCRATGPAIGNPRRLRQVGTTRQPGRRRRRRAAPAPPATGTGRRRMRRVVRR